MATKMLDQFKGSLSEVALQPSSGGAFEITVGDDVIYSKLESGIFPSEGQVLKDLAAKL